MSGEASRPRPSPWPFATGSRSPGSERGLLVPLTRPRSRARGPGRLRSPRSSSRPPPARGVHAGGGLKRGRRRAGLPSPPAPPPPSLLPPGAQQPPPPEPRAAREMAPVWPPRPAEATVGAGARDAPRPTAPATVSATTLRRGALCPGGFSGPGPARGRRQPRAPNDNRGKREEGGGGGRPPLATRSPARPPANPGPGPGRRLCSEPENKTRVWEGGASAVGRTGSAWWQAGEMLRHGANMDAGLLSFFCLGSAGPPRSPEKPASECEPDNQKRERP